MKKQMNAGLIQSLMGSLATLGVLVTLTGASASAQENAYYEAFSGGAPTREQCTQNFAACSARCGRIRNTEQHIACLDACNIAYFDCLERAPIQD